MMITYSEIPRELVYEDRESFEQFEVDDDDSIDGRLFNRLLQLRCVQNQFPVMQKKLLSIYNDVYYLMTMILVEYRPLMHLGHYRSIAQQVKGYLPGNEREAIIFTMLHCILHTLCKKYKVPKWIQLLIRQIDEELDAYPADFSESYIYRRVTEGYNYSCPSISLLQFRLRNLKYGIMTIPHFTDEDIQDAINRHVDTYFEYWKNVTDNFSLFDIVELTIRLGATSEEKCKFLEEIRPMAKYYYETYAFWRKNDIKLIDNLKKEVIEKFPSEKEYLAKEQFEQLDDASEVKKVDGCKDGEKVMNIESEVAGAQGNETDDENKKDWDLFNDWLLKDKILAAIRNIPSTGVTGEVKKHFVIHTVLEELGWLRHRQSTRYIGLLKYHKIINFNAKGFQDNDLKPFKKCKTKDWSRVLTPGSERGDNYKKLADKVWETFTDIIDGQIEDKDNFYVPGKIKHNRANGNTDRK